DRTPQARAALSPQVRLGGRSAVKWVRRRIQDDRQLLRRSARIGNRAWAGGSLIGRGVPETSALGRAGIPHPSTRRQLGPRACQNGMVVAAPPTKVRASVCSRLPTWHSRPGGGPPGGTGERARRQPSLEPVGDI